MATLQFKRIKNTFPDFFVLKNSIGKEPYKLQPGEPLVATYKDGDATRTVLVVASADGDIEFIDYDGLEARVATAEEAVKDVTFKTQDTPSLHLGKDSSGSNTILSGDVKVSTASGNILSVNSTSLGNTQGLYAKVMLKRDGNGSLVLTTSSPLGEQTQTVPLDKEVHLSENGSFYNPVNKTLSLKMSDGSAVLVDLSNVVNVADIDNNILQDKALGLYAAVDLRYDSARNILYLTKTKAGGGTEEKSFQLNSMQLLDDITYDSLKEAIVIRFITQAGEFKKIEVPVSQLIREWRPYNEMHTVQIERTENKTGGQDLLSADVKIASDPDNILTKKNYQLYVKGVASNIRYSADPSSGVTVRDKIDELQGDVSKVSSAVDTFNDAIEYVENIVSAVSGVSEAKINAIISGAGLQENTGKYVPNQYGKYISNATSLYDADAKLDGKIFEVSGKVSANTEDIQNISGQVSANTTAITSNTTAITAEKTAREAKDNEIMNILSGVSGSAPSAVVNEIIKSVDLFDTGKYKKADPVHTIVAGANTVLEADILLDSAISQVSAKTSAHTEQIDSLSGQTSANTENIRTLSGQVANISGVSQDEIDAIETGAGLTSGGSYEPDANAHYINEAQSLKNADKKLDSALYSLSSKTDATISGAGLNGSGQYVKADAGTYHYITEPSVISLYEADKSLDKGVQNVSGAVNTVSGKVQEISGKVESNTTDIATLKNTIGGTGGTSIQDQLSKKQNKLSFSEFGVVRFKASESGDTTSISGTVCLPGYVDVLSAHTINNIRIQKDSNDSSREIGLYSIAEFDYNSASNQITFQNSNGKQTYKLAGVTLIEDFYYDQDTHSLKIAYQTESGRSEVSIDITQMGIVDVQDSNTVDLTKISSTTGAVATIRADVKISTERQNNILKAGDGGGMYVDGVASNILYSQDAAAGTVYDAISALSGNVSTISGDVNTISGDIQTISGVVSGHNEVLKEISGATEDIKNLSSMSRTLSSVTHDLGFNAQGQKIDHTSERTFLSSTTATIDDEIGKLDSLLNNITSGAGFEINNGTIAFDKSRFTTDPALSASSSITDAIEDLAQYTEKGFVSGCGLTSAGTLNTSTFTGSSALSGLTSANTLADAISGLGKALDTIAGTGVNADGTFNNDVFSAGSFVSSASSLADATNKLDKALDTIAGTGLKADGTFDNSVFSSTSFISSASSLADMGQKLDNALQTIAGTGLKADGSFDNSVFSASPILSASSSITDAINDLDSAFEFCCDTAMDAIGNIDEDGKWVIPSAITENFPSGKTSGISSVSDALALLADGGIMFDDFYNDTKDPAERDYNVRFDIHYVDGKPKLAADVDYCDCGDYD